MKIPSLLYCSAAAEFNAKYIFQHEQQTVRTTLIAGESNVQTVYTCDHKYSTRQAEALVNPERIFKPCSAQACSISIKGFLQFPHWEDKEYQINIGLHITQLIALPGN